LIDSSMYRTGTEMELEMGMDVMVVV
jgi:hypothetical protein